MRERKRISNERLADIYQHWIKPSTFQYGWRDVVAELHAALVREYGRVIQEEAPTKRAEAAEADAARLREAAQALIEEQLSPSRLGPPSVGAWMRLQEAVKDSLTTDTALAPPPAPVVKTRAEAGPSEEALEAAGIVERWIGKEFDSDESCDLLLAFARALDRLAGRT